MPYLPQRRFRPAGTQTRNYRPARQDQTMPKWLRDSLAKAQGSRQPPSPKATGRPTTAYTPPKQPSKAGGELGDKLFDAYQGLTEGLGEFFEPKPSQVGPGSILNWPGGGGFNDALNELFRMPGNFELPGTGAGAGAGLGPYHYGGPAAEPEQPDWWDRILGGGNLVSNLREAPAVKGMRETFMPQLGAGFPELRGDIVRATERTADRPSLSPGIGTAFDFFGNLAGQIGTPQQGGPELFGALGAFGGQGEDNVFGPGQVGLRSQRGGRGISVLGDPAVQGALAGWLGDKYYSGLGASEDFSGLGGGGGGAGGGGGFNFAPRPGPDPSFWLDLVRWLI